MAATRTGTTVHKRMRKRTLARDRAAGVTHCPSCNVELDYDSRDRPPNAAEADEIVPYALTGETSTDPDAWRTICARCNQRKGAKTETPHEVNVNLFPHSRAW